MEPINTNSKGWNYLSKKISNFRFRRGVTSFVNPYSMLQLEEEDAILKKVDQWCVDGISLVQSFKLKVKNDVHRYSFDDTSIARFVFWYARQKNYKIAVVGTKEEFIHDAVDTIKKKYKVNVVYERNGYFDSEEERTQCMQQIMGSKADVVICGMGTPHQENFLVDLKNRGWNGYGFTCGGYLHQVIKKDNYYPKLIDKFNLRWLYRMYDEPKLLSRYFVDYPKFFMKFFLSKSL